MFTPILLVALSTDPTKPLVEFPHPLITEVLYAVPTGEGGDVNGDGVRESNGDEFIELVNPHDRSITLGGYVLSGKSSDDPKRKFKTLRFVFPGMTLQPGETVVVFNGHGAKWTGPVGDTAHAPTGGDPKFAGARVFTMGVDSARLGFANGADYVLLTAPDGKPVHCIKWGDIKPPKDVPLVETAPAADKGSVMRRTVGGELEPHPAVDGKRFSPGKFPLDASAPSEATQKPEAPAAPGKPESPKPPKKH